MIGKRVGPYQIIDKLGEGGMGEVYRGTDTRLGREVAIKVLPAATAASPHALTRFEREARAIAALNHPNICTLFDVGSENGHPYLVMELLAGRSLHDVLAAGPLALGTLIDHAIALADALHAAHACGIIHRDLKPANVVVTTSGVVKILDFGLAKDADPVEEARTIDHALTGPGATLGTLSYMSPEQLRGQAVDARTDLFSLGLVLYEMATGKRAVGGKTGAEVSAAILHEQPVAPRSVRAEIPEKLEAIILKALEKDRDLRYQSAAELRADLKRVKRDDHSDAPVAHSAPVVAPAPPASSTDAAIAMSLARRHPLAIASIAAIAIAAAALAWWVLRPRATPEASAPADLTMQPLTLDGLAGHATISPDGRFIAYVRRSGTESSVVVKQLASNSDVVILPPTAGVIYDAPSVTPDGGFVDVLVRQINVPGVRPHILRIPFLGGTARRLMEGVVSGIGWSPDGKQMAFVASNFTDRSTSLVVADVEGQNQRVLMTRRPPALLTSVLQNRGSGPPSRPSWSSDGRFIAVSGIDAGTANLREAGELIEVDVTTGAERALRRGVGLIGELAYLDGDNLIISSRGAENTEPAQWQLLSRTGSPVPLTRGLNEVEGVQLTSDRKAGVATQTITRSSIVVGAVTGGSFSEVVAESGAQAEFPWLDTQGNLFYTARTPSGFAVFRSANGQVTQVANDLLMAVASPDGTFVIGNRFGTGVVRANVNGAGSSVILPPMLAMPAAITPDGSAFVYVANSSGSQQPWLLPVSGGEPRRLSDQFVSGGRLWLSRDGRQVIFSTAGSARLCAFPSFDDCRELKLRPGPLSADGKIVYAVDPNDPRNILAQPIDGGPATPLTQFTDKEIGEFSLSPDGKQMAIVRRSRVSDVVLVKGLRSQ